MAEILTNSKARRDYHILETFEAGIVLRGTEVKALRAGKGQIRDAFARIEKDEAYLYNAHIDEYSFGNRENHDPKALWAFVRERPCSVPALLFLEARQGQGRSGCRQRKSGI